jgi:acetyl esterase/lipase
MGEKAHEGSRNYLIGKNPTEEEIRFASIEQQVDSDYPSTFLWWGDSDTCVDPDNSRMLKKALEDNHIPCMCIEYAGVDHGIGIGMGLPCEGWFEKAVAFWETQR